MSRKFRYDPDKGEVVEVRGVVEETIPDSGVVSDALGFGQHQLAEFEADRQINGFRGVEFVRDPEVPEFFQVKCSSRREHERYVKHRGFVNRTGIGGVRLSQSDLDRAASLVTRSIEERSDA